MGELIRMEQALPADVRQMTDALQAMAGMLRTMNDEIADLRRQVRMLEKVTPAQASALNAAVRSRAAELCGEYRLPGREKAVAALIRRAVRLQFGAQTARDLPRCDFEAATTQVALWDDYREMKKLKGGAVR